MEHPTGTVSLSAGKRGPMHPGRSGGGPMEKMSGKLHTYIHIGEFWHLEVTEANVSPS